MNAIQYIRDHYRVPAKIGGRIRFEGQPGTITGTDALGHLIVRPDVRRFKSTRWRMHPTWHVEYLEKGAGDDRMGAGPGSDPERTAGARAPAGAGTACE